MFLSCCCGYEALGPVCQLIMIHMKTSLLLVHDIVTGIQPPHYPFGRGALRYTALSSHVLSWFFFMFVRKELPLRKEAGACIYLPLHTLGSRYRLSLVF